VTKGRTRPPITAVKRPRIDLLQAAADIVSALPDFENKKVAYQVEDKGSQYDPSCLTPTRFAPNGLQGKNC